MAKRKTIIGKIPCPVCGVGCVVKCDDGDRSKTLNYVCHQGCDSPNYAPAGTGCHKIVLQNMTPLEGDKPAPEVRKATPPAAPAAPAPKPAPAKEKAGFFG